MPPQPIAARRFSFESATLWALVATIILAAIIIIPSSAIPFLATKTFVIVAGVIITLALYILARLARGNIILPPMWLVGALWLPALAYALSAAFSGVSFSNAFWGVSLETDTLGFMLAAAVIGTLAALALRRTEQYQRFFLAIAGALGFIAVAEVAILFFGQFTPSIITPALSIVGSYADLATLLGLGLVMALLTLRFTEVSVRMRKGIIIYGVLSLIILAVANSSLVWILVALVALALFVEAVMRRKPGAGDDDIEGSVFPDERTSITMGESGERSLIAPLVVLAVALFFLVGGTLSNALASGLHINVLDVRPSWQSTLAVGHQVYAHSPFFGSGPDTFGAQWLAYRDASLNATVFWNTDFTSGIGFIPTSFVTTGLLGALAWLVFLGAFLVLGIRALIVRIPRDESQRFVAILSFVGTVYLFAIALFGLPGSVVLALAFVYAGVFASAMRYTEGGGQWGIVFARSPRAGFVVVFGLTLLLLASIVAAYSLTVHYLAQSELSRAASSLNAGNLDAAQSAADASIAFAPSAVAYQAQTQVAQQRLAQIANSTTLSAADASSAFQTALSAGINAALTATRLAPADYQNWIALGNLYGSVVSFNVAGAYDNAKTAYEKAAALNPTSPAIPYLLAQLDVAHKDNKSAEAALTTAIGLKQDYTQAIFLLSQLEVQDGNVKAALAAAEAAAYFTPTDPNVLFQVGILRAASGDTNGAIQALSAAVAADGQFANARYFLAAVYAKAGDYTDAITQMQAVAALSDANATAVAPAIASLKTNKNPFPANLLSVPAAPVTQ